MNTVTVVGQILGILGLIGTVVCYQFNSRKKILLMQILCAVLFTLNLSCLGAWSGALLNIHGIARDCVFYQRGRRKWASSDLWVVLFCALAAVCVFVTWRSPLDLLPLIGTVFSTVSLSQAEARRIRLLTLPSPPCWFVYDMASGSIGGCLNEIFVMTSIVIAMIRYGDFTVKRSEGHDASESQ